MEPHEHLSEWQVICWTFYIDRNGFIKILPHKKLRLSKICGVNEIHENKVNWIDSIGCDHNMKVDAPEQIRTRVGNHIKMLSSYEFIETKSSEYGIENYYYNSAMWAHYGNKHTGICLIFNKEKLSQIINSISHIDKVIEGSIKYIPWREIVNTRATIEHHLLDECCENLNKLYNSINHNHLLETYFFTKSLCWEHEKEYRWLIFTESPEST